MIQIQQRTRGEPQIAVADAEIPRFFAYGRKSLATSGDCPPRNPRNLKFPSTIHTYQARPHDYTARPSIKGDYYGSGPQNRTDPTPPRGHQSFRPSSTEQSALTPCSPYNRRRIFRKPPNSSSPPRAMEQSLLSFLNTT